MVLERVAHGRPERSLILTGLRGVGKTVLLNALRSSAVRAGWGTGKLEARPDQPLRRPLSSALTRRSASSATPQPDDVTHVLGVIKSFAQRDAGPDAKLRDRWNPGIDAPAVRGRADSGDIEIDLVELLSDVGGLAADVGKGVAVFVDEMQDLGPDDVSALCAACHEISQTSLPVIVVGAGLPHLPAVLSASKSYSERLFRYDRIDRLDRGRRGPGAQLAGPGGGRRVHARRARGDVCHDRRLPVLHPGVRQGGVGLAPRGRRSPPTTSRSRRRRRETELAVGFFGSRYERATPAEREYLRAMAETAVPRPTRRRRRRVPTAAVAALLDRKPQSLSPARDALMKKGLIYSGERGRIAFTVPHFGRYLRDQASDRGKP